jgi:Mrp family chromosome partitioning ATPase/capsular polysaccharide biosynthesis protein
VRALPAASPSGPEFHADVPASGRATGRILSSIRRHPLLVAFITLQTAFVAFALYVPRERTYEATAQLLVVPIPETESSLPELPLLRSSSDRTRVMQTAANLLDSPAAAELTAQRLGPQWTAARVDGAVDVLPEGGSDVLSVTAKARNGEAAAFLANEFADAALEARGRLVAPLIANLTKQLERQLRAQRDPSSPLAVDLAERLASVRALGSGTSDPTFALTRKADVPTSPTGPSPLLLALLAVVAGFTAGVGCALLVDMFGTQRLGDAAHAVAVTGLPVLARVPRLRRIDRARSSRALAFRPAAAPALRTLQYQLELGPETRRRLLLTGGSAGDGVTTSVAEMGMTLVRAGHEVLAIDLNTRNPQLAARLGAPQPEGLAAVLGAGKQWGDALVKVPGAPGMYILAVGEHGSLGMPDEVAADLHSVLVAARERFDYVLIDAPPLADSGEALRVASAVDAIVLVLQLGRTPLEDVDTALDLLARAQRQPEGLLLVGGRASAPSGDRAATRVSVERAREPAPLRQSAEA